MTPAASPPQSLAQLLRSRDADRLSRTVAFGIGGPRTLEDFGRQAAALSRRLDGDGARYVVQCDDAFGFAVTLAALATSGSVGVLAPNAQAGTLAELARGTAGAIATGETNIPGCIDPLSLDAAPSEARYQLADPDDTRTLVELFTSGSSGEPDRIGKALRHLEAEVQVLERSFHTVVDAAQVFATVSPQHLYGLLFRVLWPLTTGRPFQRETLLRPEELSAQIATTDRATLVGTPTHLRILASSPAFTATAPKLRSVFSSGGPLAYETAAAVERATGIAPIEIFGSTETGGIAQRMRRNEDTPWVLLDSVEIDIEADETSADRDGAGRLIVSSPFVSAGSVRNDGTHMTFVTGDRVVRVADKRETTFRLVGRADRVVQIAEKRISLPDVEQRVLEHELVERVAAGSFDLQGTARLGVLVVLTRKGKLTLAERGRAHLRNELAETLAPFYDRVALPRRWRFVDTLPSNATGKTSAAAIEELLMDRLGDTTTEPILLEDSSGPGAIERRYVVPSDLVYLRGHFDRFPLVAGVVQMKWAIDATEELLESSSPTPNPRSVKFRQVLRPLQEFTLRVQLFEAASYADFSLRDGDTEFASGRLMVAGP
jgi:acyl-coenzyme A synthetase/AMP-(fatty) acid ligase